MLKFLRNLLAVLVGLTIFTVIGLVFIVGFIGSFSTSKDSPVSISNKSVLKIVFNEPVRERSEDNPFSDFGVPGGGIGIIDLKEMLRRAKTDDRIKGVYLQLNIMPAGFGSVEEIRDALIDFKKSGKFVYAYGEFFSEGAYYLASVSDKIFLNPSGLLEFNGLSSRVMFLKGTLEKLDIQPYIFRVGEFKSAVEPYFLDKMSDSSRLQTTSFLNSMYDHYLQKVSEARKLDLAQLRAVSDSMLVRNAEDALKYQLVTDVGYYDEVENLIKTKIGIDKKEKIDFISLDRYERAGGGSPGSSKNKIAVIVAQGDIVSGRGGNDNIGGDKIAEEIRKARMDKDVKAIVLRINSPGGSALASDVIWREVHLTKGKKPIIASMSDLAASGGYYMAMECDTIVAHPNTITGSIGVFGILMNIQNFMKNKLGITFDGVKTGQFSDLGNPTRPLTDVEKQIIQSEVEKIYDDFIKKAAEGRKMTPDSLKRLASGRVWSGAEAKERGLVDVLGGLDDAIIIAAKAAKIEKDYKVRYYPAQKDFFEQIVSTFGGDDAKEKMLQKELGEFYPFVKTIKRLKEMEKIQARMPFDIEVY